MQSQRRSGRCVLSEHGASTGVSESHPRNGEEERRIYARVTAAKRHLSGSIISWRRIPIPGAGRRAAERLNPGYTADNSDKLSDYESRNRFPPTRSVWPPDASLPHQVAHWCPWKRNILFTPTSHTEQIMRTDIFIHIAAADKKQAVLFSPNFAASINTFQAHTNKCYLPW